MHFYEFANYGEADAKTPFRSALVQANLREQFKDVRQVIRWYADAVV
jgi:hypothetical protein